VSSTGSPTTAVLGTTHKNLLAVGVNVGFLIDSVFHFIQF
jgi:hypothetical protein